MDSQLISLLRSMYSEPVPVGGQTTTIGQLFAWVGFGENDDEGVLGLGGSPDGPWTPLISENRGCLEAIRDAARKLAVLSGKPVRLVRFDRVAELERIGPNGQPVS